MSASVRNFYFSQRSLPLNTSLYFVGNGRKQTIGTQTEAEAIIFTIVIFLWRENGHPLLKPAQEPTIGKARRSPEIHLQGMVAKCKVESLSFRVPVPGSKCTRWTLSSD